MQLRKFGTVENPIATMRCGKNIGNLWINCSSPYCAAGVYYCFAEGCKKLNYPISYIPSPKTGLLNNFNMRKRMGKGKFIKLIFTLDYLQKGQSMFGLLKNY